MQQHVQAVMAPLATSAKWVVWGACRSWAVLQIGPAGQTLWRSEWLRSREQAERRAEQLRVDGDKTVVAAIAS